MLRGVVIGTGFAGEGYVTALRRAGVDVVALCGRSPEPAHAMGDRLGIADVRLDWRSAIDSLTPDVVVVATPAAPHCEMVEYAVGRGAHVVCEKPLGRNSDESRRMLDAVETAGVKHAYGGTTRYAPGLGQARALVADGAIGDLEEIEVVSHFGLSRLLPYCWIHSLEHGGGVLFNVYTHFLAQAQHVSGGVARWATGRTNVVVDRVPAGPPLHDFRSWAPVDPARAAAGEWRENDADLTASVITGLELADGREIKGLFHASGLAVGRHAGYLALYGTTGTLHLDGEPWFSGIRHFTAGTWDEIAFTADDNPTQSGWNQLVGHFVADVNGAGDHTYPTFRDGHTANQLIDQVRDANSVDTDPRHRGAPE